MAASAPLLLLLLENLIPLTVAVILFVVVSFVIRAAWSGDVQSREGKKEGGSSLGASQEAMPQSGKEPKIKEFDSWVKLERVKGVLSDYIRVSNGIGESEVCSAYEYDHKKVIIKQGGKVVTGL